MTQKKIREIIAEVYWLAHTEGRLLGKKPIRTEDFATADAIITRATAKFEKKPKRKV